MRRGWPAWGLAAAFALTCTAAASAGPAESGALRADAAATIARVAKERTSYVARARVAGCDLFASTSGSDAASGTGDAPFRTAKKLVRSLTPGQTGCLRPGLYVENVIVLRGGRPGAPITLRSAPGGTATIGGYVDVKDTADHVVLTALAIDGSYSPQVSVQLFGDSLVVSDTEITNRRAAQSCILAGSTKYGIARDLVLVRNRIHGCGKSATFDHGIYLSDTRNARVSDNVVYDNAAIGIQIYPDADQSLIEQNTIVGNGRIGVIFAGEGGFSSDGNVVRRNVVTHSRGRYNLETWWGGAVGSGNVARDNCVFGGGMGNVLMYAGVATGGNLVADPQYVDAVRGDFRLRAGSPCAGLGAR